MPNNLTKTAIVTGAARGIGLATSQLLSQQGYVVAMIDRDSNQLEVAVGQVPGAAGFDYDVSIPEQVKDMMVDVLAWGEGVDLLVNNAGVADFGPIEETSFDTWRRVMETNLDGVFLCTQECIPALKISQGSVVNVASISGLRASTLRIAYGTSKAAVIHLTKQQAVELGEFGIRVNCVAPGPVRTKLAMAVHTQEIIDAYHDAIPLNRYGTEEEIAHTIVYLSSPQAAYVTGQVLAADGGFDGTGVGLPALRR